ncbi:LPS translocon maturation chaperone LptM [Solimonas terrae]|uniref:Lipoprotein n=1 Tax=Solimonas terrae TaxID=1396819 RepID=A0A6M2BW94_9GAMM|nr:lipoprotein [Solimonas terrae]NGY06413.1 lipoprotein [Solimonas terrae]
MPKSIAALCVALLLSACGQTGALYLPDRGKPPARHKDKPAKVVPTAQPATPQPAPAAPDRKADATPSTGAVDSTPNPGESSPPSP